MASADDVRRIALSLPDTDEHPSYQGRPSFRVAKKGFVRLLDDGESCGIHFETLEARDALLASDPHKFFITSHQEHYPTLLVRYARVEVDELEELIIDSWRTRAPKRLLAAFDSERTR